MPYMADQESAIFAHLSAIHPIRALLLATLLLLTQGGEPNIGQPWNELTVIWAICRTLFDVFSNIRDDEAEHVKTMKACQDYSIVAEMTQRREEKRPKPVGSPEAQKST